MLEIQKVDNEGMHVGVPVCLCVCVCVCMRVCVHTCVFVSVCLSVHVDDGNDDDVVLYSTVTPCICGMIGALGRVVSFEACCQWVLLSVQITRHYLTI